MALIINMLVESVPILNKCSNNWTTNQGKCSQTWCFFTCFVALGLHSYGFVLIVWLWQQCECKATPHLSSWCSRSASHSRLHPKHDRHPSILHLYVLFCVISPNPTEKGGSQTRLRTFTWKQNSFPRPPYNAKATLKSEQTKRNPSIIVPPSSSQRNIPRPTPRAPSEP